MGWTATGCGVASAVVLAGGAQGRPHLDRGGLAREDLAGASHGWAGSYWSELLNLIGAGKGVSPASACAERFCGRPGTVWVPFSGVPPGEYGFWPKVGETARICAFVDTTHQLC